MVTTFFTATHQTIQLGKKLGMGGEGSVYQVIDNPDIVAKIYHHPLTPEKTSKILDMVHIARPELLQIASWPQDVLKTTPKNKQLVGFLMPTIQDCHAVHEIYGPASRKRWFPKADWAFLLHIAQNLARAFATIHVLGHVIGDVNQGNVCVAHDATVKLIDCDSFQIQVHDHLYWCEVGMSQFTPPELQGLSFRGLRRSPNHDNFGLAVLIFHLLFLGRHPFSGRYQGSGEMSIEQAIQAFHFAYGSGSQLMRPPPYSLPFIAVSPSVMELFERAFYAGGVIARPTAYEWIDKLEKLKTQLIKCKDNSGHVYYQSLSECPWCVLERKGVFAFIGETLTELAFDPKTIWGAIWSINSPGILNFPNINKIPLSPTPLPYWSRALVPIGKGLRTTAQIRLFSFFIFNFCFILICFLSKSYVCGSILLSIVATLLLSMFEAKKVQQKRFNALIELEQQWAMATDFWVNQAGDVPFVKKLIELENLYNEYQCLTLNQRLTMTQLATRNFKDAQRCRQIQRVLLGGMEELKAIRREVLQKRVLLAPSINSLAIQLAQARVDMQIFR